MGYANKVLKMQRLADAQKQELDAIPARLQAPEPEPTQQPAKEPAKAPKPRTKKKTDKQVKK